MTRTNNRYKLVGLLLALVMLVGMLGSFSLTASAADGGACASSADCPGTYTNGFCSVCGGYEAPTTNSDGYYEIGNAGELYWFSEQVNAGNVRYNAVLTADVVVNPSVLGADGELNGDGSDLREWIPIGTKESAYKGTFDGQNHTISGLYHASKLERVGLFGTIDGSQLQRISATVKNVGVIDSYFKAISGVRYVGFIAGYVGNSNQGNDCRIINCFSNGSIRGSDTYTCSYGGIVGYSNYQSVISECYSATSIYVSARNSVAGGILAKGYRSTVRDCYNLGDISVIETSSYTSTAGGVVGTNGGDTTGSITNCYNAGSVSATGEKSVVGSVVGSYSEGSTLSDCYYLAKEETDSFDGTTFKSAEQFASGEVAYLLNNKVGGADPWRQTLGTDGDALPSFSGDPVYMICDGTSVSYGSSDTSSHAWVNGICSVCGTEHDHSGSAWVEGKCVDCGAACEHRGNTDTDSDADTHSFTCTTCGLAYTAVPHAWEGGECKECGLICTHTWQTDGSCQVCDVQAEASVTVSGSITYYLTVEDAFAQVEAASSLATLTLLSDVEIEVSLGDGRVDNLTLGFIFDLAGRTIYCPETVINYLYYNGTMVIKDSVGAGQMISGSGSVIKASSSVEIYGGTFKASVNDPYPQSSAVNIVANGTLDMSTGIISYSAYLKIYGGTFQSADNAITSNDAEVYIYGGSFEGGKGTFDVRPDGIIRITSATFPSGITPDSGDYYVELSEILAEHCVFVDAEGNVIEITEGQTELLGSVSVYRTASVENIDYALSYVAGNTIPTPTADDFIIISDSGAAVTFRWLDGESELSGAPVAVGTYTLEVSVAGGQEYKGITKQFTVVIEDAVASLTVGDTTTNYAILADVFAAAEEADGSTVTILRDVESAPSIYVNKGNFTVDLGGMSVKWTLDVYGGTVTIVGDGTVDGLVGVYNTDTTLIIKGGKYESAVVSYDGKIVIYGGTFYDISLNKDHHDSIGEVLPDDHYIRDENGEIIDPTKVEATDPYYMVQNVTVSSGADISTEAQITVDPATYSGAEQEPVVIVTVGGAQLEGGVDFNVVYPTGYDFIGAGSTEITVTGIGNYTGSVEKIFTIAKQTPTIGDFNYTLPADLTYNGEAKAVTVTVMDGIVGMGEITVKYVDVDLDPVNGLPTNQGVYGVEISVAEGKNYTAVNDLFLVTFNISPFTLGEGHIAMYPGEYTYNGSKQQPEITVVVDGKTLVLDKDYTVTWDKNSFSNAGTYTATIQGIGNYQGTVNRSYVINPKPLLDSDISIHSTEETYSGGAYSPIISVKDGDVWLSTGPYGDFDVTWDKDGFVDAGTYTATITGKNNYSGSFTRAFVIKQAELEIELTSPITSVLPGNQIALTLNTNSDATPSWSLDNAVMVSGTIIKVNDGLIIGQDAVTITVTYDETNNFKGGSKTITLKVGMADFSGDIADLEADIAELNKLIEEDGEVDQINAKLTDITNKLTSLEDNGATDDELAAAKSEAISSAEALVNKAKSELEGAIATKADAATLNEKVAELESAIATAETLSKAYADGKDAELKAALDESIATAKSDAIKAADEALAKAKTELEGAIANKADTATLNEKVAELEAAIATAETVSKAYADEKNAALKAELESAISGADKAIVDTIDALAGDLDEMREALEARDGELETFITVVCIISSVALGGSGAFVIWFFIDRRRI